MMAQTFALRLDEACKTDGRPLKVIAHKAGYTLSHLRRMRRGARNPTLQFVETLAQTLGRSPAWLLGFEP